MKKSLMLLVLCVSFLGTLFLTPVSFAAGDPDEKEETATKDRSSNFEQNPQIHRAMRKLKAAEAELEKAKAEYGGHRSKALHAIKESLDELKLALDFAHGDKR